MPCGGIYTVAPVKEWKEWYDSCCYCDKFILDGKTPDHYIEEWDGLMLHGACVLKWLNETEDGHCVQLHEHEVQVDGVVIFREGEKREVQALPRKNK